ncbi:hypothetical protein VTK26DRAFT_8313 [Humicola hyalothermophila]
MDAIRNITANPPSAWNPYRIDHVTFTQYGAWFLRAEPSFGAGMVQISSRGRFPDTFIAMASPYLDFQNQGLQPSRIQYAFFGAEDGVLVRFTTSSIAWDRLGPVVTKTLQDYRVGYAGYGGLTFGKNTALCPYNCNEYFLHVVPAMMGISKDSYMYSMACRGISSNFMSPVVGGSRPSPHSIPGAPEPAAQQQPAVEKPQDTAKPEKREEKKKTKAAEDAWWETPGSDVDKTTIPTDSSDEIPDVVREIFGKAFDVCVQNVGRDYLTQREISAAILEAGASKELTMEVCDRADVNHDSRYDRDEFIHAMWLVAVELTSLRGDGAAPPETLTDPNVVGNNALRVASNLYAPAQDRLDAPESADSQLV